ncbi:hypothetical protein Patl1_07584 [Pistacia atlantica]|uniref:Uncharacterized protein n=1 Tax=Pistacia atlantica TaxID=434234 RepID=A0ACC1AH23_9ROSI|nr:hypothetical protein Patl1_07584 [Pistacia atlantica]
MLESHIRRENCGHVSYKALGHSPLTSWFFKKSFTQIHERSMASPNCFRCWRGFLLETQQFN